ncbi:MAG TPA: pilus assembly protein PilN [Gammaproteobacteria bacterium]|uniref:Pilus assembly protein PilN n=1 Tax=OM182 bacterium TaxID=2510334 RepID=A0A520S5B1_9GAMM|nr:MAG: pilus assembly protein PilN [Gammaproteobacteria bacterium TMED163]RZO77624.1 MAG: pilus assembly protein PilN [OM182 bacterium]HAR90284.1 pilus assembly protein PilN [Gammaproteobacteria bacterium]HAU24192.1 pilus assembly protein PilN [Gammaproteobacteria bacterium]|tara:strand:+ start:873 stop:1394 length:522 start_codon:yes stop_codon:yes gene_type:complete
MMHINLLPWRERLREVRRREFLTIMMGFVIIAGGLVFLVDRYFNGEITMQQARNVFVRAEITLLDAQVAEINQLGQQKEDIRARMNVITDLQGTRPVIVRIFDEMVRTLPNGIFYEQVQRIEDVIAVEGIAESSARITELMRNLDDSEWFKATDLSEFSVVESAETSMSASIS